MKNKKVTKTGVAAAVLCVLVIITLFISAESIFTVKDTIPTAVIDLPAAGDGLSAVTLSSLTTITQAQSQNGTNASGDSSAQSEYPILYIDSIPLTDSKSRQAYSTGTTTVKQSYGSTVTQTGFYVVDQDELVWTAGSETEVEIFKVDYENGEQKVTVASSNGDKVIAPGTSNAYNFQVSNSGSIPLTYTLTAEAYFGEKGSEDYIIIPVIVRFHNNYTGDYLTGTSEEWSPVLELNGASETIPLAGNSYIEYTLEWEWPFETDDTYEIRVPSTVSADYVNMDGEQTGDVVYEVISLTGDDYDTFLGNLAAEGQDIELTVVLNVIAEEYTDDTPSNPPSIPDDPDDTIKDDDLDDFTTSEYPDAPDDPDNMEITDIPTDTDTPSEPANPDSPSSSTTPGKPSTGTPIGIPKTGDNSNMILWIVLALVSLTVMLILILVIKQREKGKRNENKK
jgi:hypothetical protein